MSGPTDDLKKKKAFSILQLYWICFNGMCVSVCMYSLGFSTYKYNHAIWGQFGYSDSFFPHVIIILKVYGIEMENVDIPIPDLNRKAFHL